MTKIVVIGAGSASFGPGTLATILRSEQLKGSTIGLVDIDAGALERVATVARLMNEAWDAEMTIQAAMDSRELLPEAEFVIYAIEVQPREKLWRMDWEATLKHGLRQPYGENGGPGGMMHTFRQVPPLMATVRRMEDLCPGAWLINFSNPLTRLTRAVTKHSRISVVGKCHQLAVGYALAITLLADHFEVEVPTGVSLHSSPDNHVSHRLAQIGRQHLKIKAAGLNHFTWMLDVRDRMTGEDLYPALRAAAQCPPPTLEPLSMELFRMLDYCPVPGDSHLSEYTAWTHDAGARPWEHYHLRLYDWSSNEHARNSGHALLQRMIDREEAVDTLRDTLSEGAAEIITAISHNENFYDEAVNITNGGAIPNLPPETVVEIPALVSAAGVHGLSLPALPPVIAELCRREAALVERVVDAAVTGDRSLALQALMLDPMINDLRRARAILDDYLSLFAEYLPQFAS